MDGAPASSNILSKVAAPLIGPLLIGLVISSFLLGLTTLQTYFYYLNYWKDRFLFKLLVAVLWILDVLATIFVSHASYYYMVSAYGNPTALSYGEWSLIAEVLLTVIIAVLVQIYFAYRVFGVTRNNYFFAGLVLLMSVGVLVTGVWAVVKLYQIKTFSRLPEALGLVIASLGFAAGNDILITVILCVYLQRTKSHFKETRSVIRMLMLYTIETGLLTSMVAIADVVALTTMQNNWIFIAISVTMPKLYANSLLTILNSRKSLKTQDGTSMTLRSVLVTTVRTQEVSPMPMKSDGDAIPLSPMLSPMSMKADDGFKARQLEYLPSEAMSSEACAV